jgi:EAL domain-containing protein (putative c-di-GMP-specific phosphodiesterase class I)
MTQVNMGGDRLKALPEAQMLMPYEARTDLAPPRTAAIVRATVALGKELGIAVLAEGVESEDQLNMLTDFGCLQVQGYLLTPPVCASEARSLLGKRWGARRSGSADAR